VKEKEIFDSKFSSLLDETEEKKIVTPLIEGYQNRLKIEKSDQSIYEITL